VTLFDLFFLLSILFVFGGAAGIAVSAIRGRWKTARRLSLILGLYVALYAAAVMCFALVLPRRFYAPGERRCFDDWCAAAVYVELARDSAESPCASDNGAQVWVAAIEVSSVARRVRQSAPDARAELEDESGSRYRPCATSMSGNSLSDMLGPGESFRVILPFRLPSAAVPAGVVLHHGDFPGAVIIGADQSFLHPPALQRVAFDRKP